jgi:hypothetical protein
MELLRAEFKGGRTGASTKQGPQQNPIFFLRRKASRKSSPETDYVIDNLLRVEKWGYRLQPGVERRRVCVRKK